MEDIRALLESVAPLIELAAAKAENEACAGICDEESAISLLLKADERAEKAAKIGYLIRARHATTTDPEAKEE